ncbi:MAG: extracellular solute-binding protein [Anaerolineaceae bacterium]|nr:extracellular solute-binding protein [Anaerolineaceae bacterium]
MRTKVFAMVILLSMILSACAQATATTAPAAQPTQAPVVQTVVVQQTQIVEKQVVVTPTAGPNPEAVIQGVEPNAEISFWTFYLSPTFDPYIKSTIARFEQTYPGVKVDWEDHQATFLDDYRNAFAAGNAPDVANLSDTEGWVREFASKGLLLSMTDNLPQNVINQYYPGLFNLQLVDGKSYQVPWYQAIAIELINRQVYDKTGLKVEDFPKTFDGIPALCATIKQKTGTLCDIRLTMTNLLQDMAYQGGVKVMSDDGKTFTFNSADGVAWLQMYVDMVNKGLLDKTALTTTDDRVGLQIFTTGKAAFYQTGPQLIRDVRSNSPGLYGYLAAVPLPVGKSGKTGPTSMAISVKKDTKFPKASLALATFFTDPQSQLEFSKIVGIYPSTPASYDDPFFSGTPVAIEESVRPLAKGLISQQADIMPQIPQPSDVNEIVRKAIEQALFNGVPAQKALDGAVTQANALIK